MIEALRDIKDYDAIFFTPHDEEVDMVNINAATYKEHGEKIGHTEMGDFYDIILFRMSEEDDIIELERFEAILIDPKVYVSRMVHADYYGLVAKKTTTSFTFTEDVFAKWSEA